MVVAFENFVFVPETCQLLLDVVQRRMQIVLRPDSLKPLKERQHHRFFDFKVAKAKFGQPFCCFPDFAFLRCCYTQFCSNPVMFRLQ